MLKNKNIKTFLRLEPPSYFLSSLPITAEIENMILRTREEIEDIIKRKSKKLLFIVGPCSIHDPEAALEYGEPHQINWYESNLLKNIDLMKMLELILREVVSGFLKVVIKLKLL